MFIDDADRRAYLRLLGWVVRRAGWRCIAYCLMSNHVHLLVLTPKPNLGRGMQVLHGDFARAFNDRHGLSGHLFQGRFDNKLVEDDEQFIGAAVYIARNPVEAGMCGHPRDWAWSSYGRGGPSWVDLDPLFEVLAAAGGDPRRRYDELVSAPGPAGC
jgi:REP element-mobilizing transposase RayT